MCGDVDRAEGEGVYGGAVSRLVNLRTDASTEGEGEDESDARVRTAHLTPREGQEDYDAGC